jgi:hypothetical protein
MVDGLMSARKTVSDAVIRRKIIRVDSSALVYNFTNGPLESFCAHISYNTTPNVPLALNSRKYVSTHSKT